MSDCSMLHKYSKRGYVWIFEAFLHLLSVSSFLYFGGIFNKTIISFTLFGYQIGATHLGVGYLTFHIQRALVEQLLPG